MKKFGLYIVAIILLPLYLAVNIAIALVCGIINGIEMTRETFEEIVDDKIQ